MAIEVVDRESYEYVKSRGFEPLIDMRFKMNIELRKAIQSELFEIRYVKLYNFDGSINVEAKRAIDAANQRFYYWVWDNSKHYCEETLRPIFNYSSINISHILSRGAFPEIAHDPRNINILSYDAHNMWEIGDRKGMRIFNRNEKIIEILLKEYQININSDGFRIE